MKIIFISGLEWLSWCCASFLKVLPRQPSFLDYVARATDRPAYRRFTAREAELAQKVTLPAFAGGG